MTVAHINRIGTAVPPHDIHEAFLNFMANSLPHGRARQLFARMARRSGIAHRYAVLPPHEMAHEIAQNLTPDLAEIQNRPGAFYQRGAFPGTAARMNLYNIHAPALAEQAVAALRLEECKNTITHLVVASCTGFMAPGLDLQLAKKLGLRADLQRTLVGFMGCSAAIPALRIAQATILAEPTARVLVVNLELSSLHLQETDNVQTALSLLLFGDGAAAALVTAEPIGMALGDFRTALIPDSENCITWHIGDHGFIMHLCGTVPTRITKALRAENNGLISPEGASLIDLWAVHGGGRSVLDAVETGLLLAPDALAVSRGVLHRYGNMSSATIMFTLAHMLHGADNNPYGDNCGNKRGDESRGAQHGLALAFGPGMVAETFRFTRLA